MIDTYIYAFVSVLGVSLLSLVGVFTLSLREETVRKYTFLFISLAIGALLGDAFIHLIPESMESSLGSTLASVLVIGGILIFFIIEKFLHWHHHTDDTEENHNQNHTHSVLPVGKLVLVSDGVHNFIDGVIIGASFLISIPLGLATTLAVMLHEIPQEIGDFGVLLHAGYTKARALWLNFVSGVFAMLGLAFVFVFGENNTIFAEYLLPIAAGGFIYIAVADLIPELQKNKKVTNSVVQMVMILVGVGAMLLLTLME